MCYTPYYCRDRVRPDCNAGKLWVWLEKGSPAGYGAQTCSSYGSCLGRAPTLHSYAAPRSLMPKSVVHLLLPPSMCCTPQGMGGASLPGALLSKATFASLYGMPCHISMASEALRDPPRSSTGGSRHSTMSFVYFGGCRWVRALQLLHTFQLYGMDASGVHFFVMRTPANSTEEQTERMCRIACGTPVSLKIGIWELKDTSYP